MVARVGDSEISRATLAHWMTVLAPRHAVPDPPLYRACIRRSRTLAPRRGEGQLRQECGRSFEQLQARALRSLISSRWLVGEAASEGVPVSQREVERGIAERERAFPGGRREFVTSLEAISQTVSDVELEVRSELAADKLRRRHAVAHVSEGEVASYYAHRVSRFRVAERRYFDILEFLPSAAAARRLIGEVEHGKNLADMSLHESLRRTSPSVQGVKRPLYEAIFAARLHAIVGPVRIKHAYFVVEVTRITPASLKTLAQVRGAITKRLTAERRRASLAAFIRSWRSRWTARTDCRPGYVIQKCRQYAGRKAPEDPLTLE